MRYFAVRMIPILLLLPLLFLGGCSGSDATEPKNALNTYLEGLRDLDYEKLMQTAGIEQIKDWPENSEEVIELIKRVQEETTGSFKSWTLEQKPYFDELNNQAIIKADIETEKSLLVISFDMRKVGDNWRVYSSEVINETKFEGLTDKKADPSAETP